ncbi:MAG: type II secretion system secretin GspD [Desulfuromonadales bacterium]|nr:type II secretion system secretin GspD [Desulfuromonadales bacterium]
MQRRPFILATLALFFALTFAPLCPLAEAQTPVKKEAATTRKAASVTLDFKDVELTDLIQTISEMTGRNFVYDDTVKGKVTIISPRGMSLDEAYQVFLSVLSVKGFTVVPAGKMNKVVRSQEAKENTIPTGSDAASSGAEQIVTRLVPVQNIDAATFAATILTPLIPKSGSVVAYAPTNTLIITDSMANIERLLKIIAELDVPGTSSNLDVIFLENASAEEIAQISTQVLAQAGAAPRTGRGAARAPTATGKVLAYPRANAIIVMAEAEELETIRTLVRSLDRKESSGRSNINVFYLENADAESLAKTLNEIISGVRKTKPVPGQATGPTEPVTITADKSTNSLIISAIPEDYEALQAVVRQLDIKRKQVYVEALILELSMDDTLKLGTSLQGAGTTSNGVLFGTSNQVSPGLGTFVPNSAGIPSLLTQTVEGIVAGGIFNMIDVTGADGTVIRVPAFSALISLSKTNSDINILAAPRLLTLDNEEAQIIVGSNVPIITSRLTSGASTDLNQSVSVERKDVALTLRFTPQITEGKLVRLKVFQETTDIASNSVGDVNQVGPTFTKRLLQNTVVAQDGKTVVLGGLIGNSTQEVTTKVPLLGDIPFLGWLFKRKSTVEKKTNMLIFITPYIIRDDDDLIAITRNSHGAMNRFQQAEMKDALKKNRFASELMDGIAQQSEVSPPQTEMPGEFSIPPLTVPETPPHE